jgi:uncharacterized protein YjeT (DUF2065 family)
VVTQRTLQQVITADRADFTEATMKDARPAAEQLGVNLIDVRITKIDLPTAGARFGVRAHACDLQGAGRQVARRGRRNLGDARAPKPNKQQTEILADAARQAGQIRGDGDASASEMYARSYSKNAEFYSFYRSMQSYRESIGTQSDILVWRRIAPTSSISNSRKRRNSAGKLSDHGYRLVGIAALLGGAFRALSGARGHLAVPQSGRGAAPDGQVGANGDAQLAVGGLISMVAGLALLWMARNG